MIANPESPKHRSFMQKVKSFALHCIKMNILSLGTLLLFKNTFAKVS